MVRSWMFAAIAAGCVSVPGESTPPPEEVFEAESVPVYGGTLETNAQAAVLADPENDEIWIVDRHGDVSHAQLEVGSQPFRVALTDAEAFVTLRGAGSLVRVDLATAMVTGMADVCLEPRGVALDGSDLYVACASGELVTLDSDDLQIQDSWFLQRDLRDVVVDAQGNVWLSRFKTAEALLVDPQNRTLGRRVTLQPGTWTPRTAWRLRPHPEHGVLMLHQAANPSPVGPAPGADGTVPNDVPTEYYGSNDATRPCSPGLLVRSHLTHVSANGPPLVGAALDQMVLPVDFAVQDRQVAVAMAHVDTTMNPFATAWLASIFAPEATCAQLDVDVHLGRGITTSVGSWRGHWVTGTRDPVGLQTSRIGLEFSRLYLQARPREAHSNALRTFHSTTPALLACASCHPEGQEDGHTWDFTQFGLRRTQSLSGGILHRAPYHWDGSLQDMEHLMGNVFSRRMGAPGLERGVVDALAEWLDGIETVQITPSGDRADVGPGRAIFQRADVACAGCHRGEQFTDNQLHVVVEGQEATKTPSLLGVGSRAPFMHTGCAETLMDRFTDPECGGGDLHGTTSHLTDPELRALVTYLQTL